MQSFSYSEHSFVRKYSCTCNPQTTWAIKANPRSTATHRICFNRLRFHVQIPNFNTQVVPRHHISSRVAQLHVADRADDFPEEAFVVHLVVFWLFEELRMLIAKSGRSHVTESNRSFTTRIHEQVAVARMKLSRCDNFRQLFHVRWLDVNDIERLIGDFQVPQVDS